MTEKMTIPTVSVIVPNFNHAEYLRERLDSILSQTYKNFEIIILDDCSTDNSREIIESYRTNPKISKIIYNEKNSGKPFLQWEKGINLASGDIIWIAENDDSCSSDLLEKLIEPLCEDPDCVISYCRSILIDGFGNKIGYHTLQEEDHSDFKMNGKNFVSKRMLYGNCILNASAVLFRKIAFFGISREYRDYYGLGDIIFWSEIAARGNVCYCAKEMNYFRQHPLSQTASLRKKDNRIQSIYESRKRWDYFIRRGIISKSRFRMREVGILCYSLQLSESEYETKCIKSEFEWKLLWPLVVVKRLKDRIFYNRKKYCKDEIVRY